MFLCMDFRDYFRVPTYPGSSKGDQGESTYTSGTISEFQLTLGPLKVISGEK